MRFYGRTTELELLNTIWKQTSEKARLVVITGPRRIGKTMLARTYMQDKPHLYLFISKKKEELLCQEFVEQINSTFPSIPIIGTISKFRDLFTLLLEIGKKQPYVLVLDEFHEFFTINPTIFSELQDLWDRYVFETKVQLIIMGSVYSLMHTIFEDAHEPLFGRSDRIIRLQPFSIALIYSILKEHGHSKLDLLFHYFLISGGKPKYIELLYTNNCFSKKAIFDFILSPNSPFIDEGKNILIEEFGKEYSTYFSILALIAEGKTSRKEVESVLQKDIGGYLDRLENYYGVLKKNRSIHASPQTRSVKYQIRDLFLSFWFRFIYKNQSAVENQNFGYIHRILERDFSTYQGKVLELFFLELFTASHQFNRVGSYWRQDNSDEIDVVGINDLDKKIVIAEVKLNKERMRMQKLQKKAESLLQHFVGYSPDYLTLSLEDALPYI